jgi:hemolysin III
MGWTIVLVIRPLYEHLPLNGLLWVIGGGLAYTIGVIFFVAKRKYSHLIWHLFTITGTTCHYLAILWYAF